MATFTGLTLAWLGCKFNQPKSVTACDSPVWVSCTGT